MCYDNQLSNLDLTNNTAITILYCQSNKLTNLDLSKNTAITELSCRSNQLTNLDLTNNTAITILYCQSNKLTNLDLSKNTAIKHLNCNGNQLTSLDLTNNTDITSLDCDNNLFPFSELQRIKEHYPELAYDSYKRLFSSTDEILNYQIDYSSEVLIDGNETSFKWYKYNYSEVTAEDIKEDGNGMFTFLKEGSYHCKMTNTSFPGLTIKTNKITVYNKTNFLNITDANFKKALVDNSLINLDGDSEISEYEAVSFKDELDVSNLNIADLAGIEYFKNITKLACNNNQISELNLNWNLELRELNVDQNHLPLSELNKIKVKNPKLIEVDKLSADYLSRQFDVFDEVNEEVNHEIDYSLEASFDENETTFKWTTDLGMKDADESEVSMIEPGVFKFLKEGIYHCEMTNAAFPDISVTTKSVIISEIVTGIEDVLESSTQIYPNPVVSEMVVKFKSSEERTIRIFDLQGRLKLQEETSSTSERLNLSDFKSGMYLMKVQSASGSFTYKIIKK